MMQDMVYRFQYRARFASGIDETEKQEKLALCRQAAQKAIDSGELMTAALYYYYDNLFLYYEAIGEEREPAFMDALNDLLVDWPSLDGSRKWAKMHIYYYHCQPQSVADWRRKTPPQRRRGRIALLYHDKIFSYMYHHCAIVREGLLPGDPYQCISVYDDLLFSYFEEPRGSINIRRDLSQPSKAIEDWKEAKPDLHFKPLPEANGEHFLLLEDYFALGEC